jgi:hypothetical protein
MHTDRLQKRFKEAYMYEMRQMFQPFILFIFVVNNKSYLFCRHRWEVNVKTDLMDIKVLRQ